MLSAEKIRTTHQKTRDFVEETPIFNENSISDLGNICRYIELGLKEIPTSDITNSRLKQQINTLFSPIWTFYQTFASQKMSELSPDQRKLYVDHSSTIIQELAEIAALFSSVRLDTLLAPEDIITEEPFPSQPVIEEI